MIALSDNPSIPRSGADDYCPENMSKKLLRSLYCKIGSLIPPEIDLSFHVSQCIAFFKTFFQIISSTSM